MKRALLIAVTVLLLLTGCGGATGGPSAHRTPATASPKAPAAAPSTTPTAPVPQPAGAPSDVPTARAPAPTPVPTSAPVEIPHHGQDLRFSGGISGRVQNAEVKDCGAGGGGWGMDLSNFSLGSSTASLSLMVSSYTGPGAYTPSGSLVLIVNQQASIYSVTGGSITVQSPEQGTLTVTVTMNGAAPIGISGDWACSG